MKNSLLDVYIIEIKADEYKRNKLINQYSPFIKKCTFLINNSSAFFDEDELFISAMEAFNHSITTYKLEKGNFLIFAKSVIRNRIIDSIRKQKSYNTNIEYIEDYKYNSEDSNKLINNSAIHQHDIDIENQARRIEINELTKELNLLEIDFYSLVKLSPTHEKTRKLCSNIVKWLLLNQELVAHIKNTGRLPLEIIEIGTMIKRKKFERYRKYIITMVIVLSGEYFYIRDYLKNF